MKHVHKIFLALPALVLATPAAAHIGPHTDGPVATLIHWLTSPTHAFFAITGSMAILAVARLLKNRRS